MLMMLVPLLAKSVQSLGRSCDEFFSFNGREIGEGF